MRHDDAALWFGEMSIFVLWWSVEDFEKGRVDKCPTCIVPWGDITDVYQQSPRMKCPNCYGTTFEGGFRALIHRPALWDHSHADQDIQRRGLATKQVASIQPTTDFEMRDNDCVIRSDNTRWRIEMPKQTEVTTGFGTKAGFVNVLTSVVTANLEDKLSVVYDIPVDLTRLTMVGWNPTVPYPNASWDIVNGPLTLD